MQIVGYTITQSCRLFFPKASNNNETCDQGQTDGILICVIVLILTLPGLRQDGHLRCYCCWYMLNVDVNGMQPVNQLPWRWWDCI